MLSSSGMRHIAPQPNSSSSLRSLPSLRAGVTHPLLHLRDVHDAQVVLEAVRQRKMPLMQRRLLAGEREELKSGNVFVWEEAQDDGGLVRWTDGRRWSQSRLRGDFLFYEEKIEITPEEREAKALRRAQKALDSSSSNSSQPKRRNRPTKPDGLTKQTYSAIVRFPQSGETRKWHIVAYFSAKDYFRLPVIDDYQYLRTITIPPGTYTSKDPSRRLGRPGDRDGTPPQEDDRTHVQGATHAGLSSPISSASSSSPSSRSSRLSSATDLNSKYTQGGGDERRLPPLLVKPSAAPVARNPGVARVGYAPLSEEDRRMLDKFRIVL
ncbi:Gti1/Pac2 family-domain-containing protein [Infundibulicybe gibba]|nr:Gti1/Pac2 family-domain-containing protein [Infundibulicybe gibba]